MNKRILIVEDDNDINIMIQTALKREGYECVGAYSGTEALLRIEAEEYSLVILDLMLPGMTGQEVLSSIRKKTDIPVIVLSARDELDTKVDLLTLGANDYMTKPYATKELIARIHSALRRHEEPKIIVDPAFTIGDLSIYPERHEVRASDEVVDLTKKEFDLLLFLAKNNNRVLKREEILEKVWGYGYAGKTNIVDVYVRYLRSKIDEKVGKKYIHTVRGIGYVARD